ncbi:hypothetical protein SAMN05661080_02484 [Modestobacter sp. DSM 44400]|uniref:hypothetical protein n=1 Tax=Modestobacter sp. DSM 44400 TaxID=1550230 RepID=UPI00089939CD|nr:hypothetical protein [Modestobacter sp. DSM 44400]SDY15316.1 hypothetical protein SAMN05661080_02484 [Modestobacter sp. DSM 44400]
MSINPNPEPTGDLDWSEEDLSRLEMISAIPGIAKIVGGLAQVVENALSPALRGRRVQSCLHIMDEINTRAFMPMDTVEDAEPGRRPLLCPRHPERLLCNKPDCFYMHYLAHHSDEPDVAVCFVCSTPVADLEFEGVTAEVQLHRQLPFYDDHRHVDAFWTYRGTLGVLPVAYLCPRHDRLIDLPVQLAWPTGGTDDVQPEDVYRLA